MADKLNFLSRLSTFQTCSLLFQRTTNHHVAIQSKPTRISNNRLLSVWRLRVKHTYLERLTLDIISWRARQEWVVESETLIFNVISQTTCIYYALQFYATSVEDDLSHALTSKRASKRRISPKSASVTNDDSTKLPVVKRRRSVKPACDELNSSCITISDDEN